MGMSVGSKNHPRIVEIAASFYGHTVTYTCADYVTCACLRHLYMRELLLRHLYMHTPFGWGGRIGWAGQLVLHVCCDIYIRRFQQWGALWFQQFMRKTGRHLQLRNFTYNSVASTTTSFFCTTWSLLRTTLDPASCWLSQACRGRECTSDRNPACTSDTNLACTSDCSPVFTWYRVCTSNKTHIMNSLKSIKYVYHIYTCIHRMSACTKLLNCNSTLKPFDSNGF